MVKIIFDEPPQTSSTSTEPLKLTEAAAKRLQKVYAKQTQQPAYLRVSILGGGCNGFNYNFAITHSKNHTDTELTHPNYPDITVLIESSALPLLAGSTLDFEDTVTASRFIINNPNATSSCGCGTSFGVK